MSAQHYLARLRNETGHDRLVAIAARSDHAAYVAADKCRRCDEYLVMLGRRGHAEPHVFDSWGEAVMVLALGAVFTLSCVGVLYLLVWLLAIAGKLLIPS